MTDIIFQTATEIAQAIRDKKYSSEEVVRACLNRIETVNADLNAVVQLVAEQAINSARQADADLAQGISHGRLHGVPMTIKDSFDTAGIISTGGTTGRANFIPEKDATIVARLKNEGAILMGKTNTSELTLSFETNNLVYGLTRNPYNLERSPGGSSGGAAAIVASGGAFFDIGSDYGGSVRLPAHFSGIAGIKPTTGRVPRTGHIIPYGIGASDTYQQIGPLTRSVADLKLILPIIAGADWQDPAVFDIPLGNPDAVDLRALRVAYFTDNGTMTPIPEIVDTVKQVAESLRGQVASIEENRPPRLEESWALWESLHNADGGHAVLNVLAQAGTDNASTNMRKVSPEHSAASPKEFGERLRNVDQFRSEVLGFMKNYDVLICPVNANVGIPHGTLGTYRAGYSYTITFNLTGYPGAVVRAGTSNDGLPIGIQIIARPYREDVALAVAEVVESAFGGWQAPPL